MKQKQQGLTYIELVTVVVILALLARAGTSIGVTPRATTDLIELDKRVVAELARTRSSALTASDLPGQAVQADFSAIGADYRTTVSVSPAQLTFTYPYGGLDAADVPAGQAFVNLVITVDDLQKSYCVRAQTGRVIQEPCQ